jgi:hypothetical protein
MKETATSILLSAFAMAGYLLFSNKFFLLAAIFFILLAISSGRLTGQTGNLLHRLTRTANRIFTGTMLAIIYLLVLTPVAGLQRFFFQNPISLKPGESESTFSSRNHIYTSKDFENPW